MTSAHRRLPIRYALIGVGFIICVITTLVILHAVQTHMTVEHLKKEAARVQSVTGIAPNSFSCNTGSVTPQCIATFDAMNLRHIENMFKKSGYSFDGVTAQTNIQATNQTYQTRVSIGVVSEESQTQRTQIIFSDSKAKH